MKEDFEKIHAKLEKLDTRLDSIDITLAKQEVNLAEHMRRTKINEESIDVLRTHLTPISNHVHVMSIVGKTLLTVIGSSTFLYVFQKLFG
jgi:hypothetical protein